MKSEKLLQAIGQIDDNTLLEYEECIKQAQAEPVVRRRFMSAQFAIVAAAAVILVAGTVLMLHALAPEEVKPETTTSQRETDTIAASGNDSSAPTTIISSPTATITTPQITTTTPKITTTPTTLPDILLVPPITTTAATAAVTTTATPTTTGGSPHIVTASGNDSSAPTATVKDNKIAFTRLNHSCGYGNWEANYPMFLATSFDDLTKIALKINTSALSYSFAPLNLSNNYFFDKALVIINGGIVGHYYQFDARDLYREGNSLLVDLNINNVFPGEEGQPTTRVTWTATEVVILEVARADIVGVTQVTRRGAAPAVTAQATPPITVVSSPNATVTDGRPGTVAPTTIGTARTPSPTATVTMTSVVTTGGQPGTVTTAPKQDFPTPPALVPLSQSAQTVIKNTYAMRVLQTMQSNPHRFYNGIPPYERGEVTYDSLLSMTEIIHYYGTYSGYHVVVMGTGESFTSDYRTIEVEGYVITQGSGSFEVLVTRESPLPAPGTGFMSLQAAFNQGELTLQNIHDIWHYSGRRER